MKILSAVLLTIISISSFATDLYVKEFGGGNAYSNINDALAASNAGDRILIMPKAGDAPYIENVLITKSLQLLTASNGGKFTLQGNISVDASLPAGSVVVVDGGSVVGNVAAIGSNNIISFSFVNSTIASGNLVFGPKVKATIANNTITYTGGSYAVVFSNGKLLGNTITANTQGIDIEDDAVPTVDTVIVAGNNLTITTDFSTTTCKGLVWANTTDFFNISNNYINQNYSGYNANNATNSSLIAIGSVLSVTNKFNNIINNTLRFGHTTGGYSSNFWNGISGSLDSRCNLFNNLIIFSSTSTTNRRAFSVAGAPQISYNTIVGAILFNSGTAVNDGTNTLTSSMPTLSANGCPTSVTNTGHPDPIFTDLDLTRNDVGACGGSYNITTNFLTPGTTGTAKVHWLEAPRRVSQGGTLSIKAEGHDR